MTTKTEEEFKKSNFTTVDVTNLVDMNKKSIEKTGKSIIHIPQQPASISDLKREFKGEKSIAFATTQVSMMLIPGLGKQCGCGNPTCVIRPKWVTKRHKSGKMMTYLQKPRPTAKFATDACYRKAYNMAYKQKTSGYTKTSLGASISLLVGVNEGGEPIRAMTLYYGKNQKKIIHITKESSPGLWETLDQVCKYRAIETKLKKPVEIKTKTFSTELAVKM